MLDCKVVILSSGRGFRLNPLTLERPKALCPIANISVIQRLLEQLYAGGIRAATLSLPPSAEHFKPMVKKTPFRDFHLDVDCDDGEAVGQVGGVRHFVGPQDKSVLVVYGDSLLSVDFGKFIETHRSNRSSRGGLATILYHRPKDIRIPEKNGRTYHGLMAVREDGRITRFEEKPTVDRITADFDLANAAVFIIEMEMLDRPEFKNASNFSYDVFQPAVEMALPIFGCDIGNGFRYDVGGIGRWYDLNMEVIRKQIVCRVSGREVAPKVWCADDSVMIDGDLVPPVLLGQKVRVGKGRSIGPEVIIGDDCEIGENVSIRQTVIMENCQIGSNTVMERCVIGPHSRIADGVHLPQFTCLGAYSVVGADQWTNWAQAAGFEYRKDESCLA